VVVMYLGRVVEEGDREQVFTDPRHPYTRSLLASIPRAHQAGNAVPLVRSEPPSPVDRPSGCAFHPRCPRAEAVCAREAPVLLPAGRGDHAAACHFRHEDPLVPRLGS
jgi:oligopeptide/dipeptide ABC transporter ATP-binding protein